MTDKEPECDHTYIQCPCCGVFFCTECNHQYSYHLHILKKNSEQHIQKEKGGKLKDDQ